MERNIVSLNEARAKGLTHYFTGKPCIRGHISDRFTSIQKCKECAREDTMRVYVHKTDKRHEVVDTASFVCKAQEVHGDRYTYEKAVFVAAKTKVEVTCRVHGGFYTRPDNHTHGKGCPKCRNVATTLRSNAGVEGFVKKAMAVYGGSYTYEDAVYVDSHTAVEITCAAHGKFWQTPTNHLTGKVGCPKCNHMKSAPEEEVADLLDIFTPVIRRDREMLKPKELDIVIPERNLAVEYCGEYYHSSGDAESDPRMSTKHISKHKACEALGVRLITIFESEWLNHNYAIRRLLRNAIGKSRGKVMARKCELRPVAQPEARAFYDRYHPQGGAGAGEHYGLYYKDRLVACMRFTHGANDRGKNRQRVWTLSRYATRVTVAGGASRLFKAFMVEHSPTEVKSFSDNRHFGGGMYSTLGFVEEAESGADYQVWHPKLGLTSKAQWQRRNIPAVAKQLGLEVEFDAETDPRSERDMTYLLGGRRIYDCGKKRWVWRGLTAPKNPDTLPTPAHPDEGDRNGHRI